MGVKRHSMESYLDGSREQRVDLRRARLLVIVVVVLVLDGLDLCKTGYISVVLS